MNLYDICVDFMVIPLALLTGIYFSYKLKLTHFIQLRKAFSCFKNSNTNDNNISSFAALSTILGGNLGTGNISGVAVALTTGGPGAILWMLITILITSVIKYVNCFIGIKYRIRTKIGKYIGGPMYYIQYGISSRLLAYIIAILLLISSLTVGNLVQVNSLVLPIAHSQTSALILGSVIACLVFLVITGGLRWFDKVITNLVPAMAILYLGSCIYILITHSQSIMPAINSIFTSAFDYKNINGGILGYSISNILSGMQVGFSRGIFAADIGLGLESIVHSSVEDERKNKDFIIEQSAINILSPLIVMVVCVITGLVLIVTDVWQDVSLESTRMCFEAFKIGMNLQISGYIMLVTLFCFAFTTILTWFFCSNKVIEYLTSGNKRIVRLWAILFVILLPIGAISKISILWNIADFSISIILLINLISLIGLFQKIKWNEIKPK